MPSFGSFTSALLRKRPTIGAGMTDVAPSGSVTVAVSIFSVLVSNSNSWSEMAPSIVTWASFASMNVVVGISHG